MGSTGPLLCSLCPYIIAIANGRVPNVDSAVGGVPNIGVGNIEVSTLTLVAYAGGGYSVLLKLLAASQ